TLEDFDIPDLKSLLEKTDSEENIAFDAAKEAFVMHKATLAEARLKKTGDKNKLEEEQKIVTEKMETAADLEKYNKALADGKILAKEVLDGRDKIFGKDSQKTERDFAINEIFDYFNFFHPYDARPVKEKFAAAESYLKTLQEEKEKLSNDLIFKEGGDTATRIEKNNAALGKKALSLDPISGEMQFFKQFPHYDEENFLEELKTNFSVLQEFEKHLDTELVLAGVQKLPDAVVGAPGTPEAPKSVPGGKSAGGSGGKEGAEKPNEDVADKPYTITNGVAKFATRDDMVRTTIGNMPEYRGAQAITVDGHDALRVNGQFLYADGKRARVLDNTKIVV
ncbi:MAG: hypothetical protein AABZ32_01340, partial [Bacteroidota bacterium]